MPSAAAQAVGSYRLRVVAGLIAELRTHTVSILFEADELASDHDSTLAKPLAHSPVQHALEVTTMNRELWHVVTCMQTARFAPDLVAVTIHHDQLTRADRGGVKLFEEIQFDENLDGVRQDGDADTQLANGSGLLVHDAVDAARVQGRSCGEATDSAANDQDSHSDLAGRHQRRTGQCNRRGWAEALMGAIRFRSSRSRRPFVSAAKPGLFVLTRLETGTLHLIR